MDQNQDKKQNTLTDLTDTDSPTPFLEWKSQFNDETGKLELDSLQLSDDTQACKESLKKALKKASGTTDPKVGERILKKIARGLSSEGYDNRLNETSALLPSLEPKNPTEALLLGQFLALNDSGMKCLRLANVPDQGFYHMDKLFALANKLLNTANQTMLAIQKLRSGGQQTVQVIHVHNEGQAVVAQNLSSHSRRSGRSEKNLN